MRTLSLTPKAESDLIDIWVYTCEECCADQVDGYLDRLETGMRPLIQPPLLGTDYAHVLPGYRRLQVEHHAVFYRVLEAEVLVHEYVDEPERLLD